ncbi:MAG: type II toxin-antitoxin system PemK/MazF family toxin [Gammaproteobacteria bacterium]|nr:MAG: type II toxin-antitoxin system PemK/MazF family toxin [Gammaproteobacteria bacterium]
MKPLVRGGVYLARLDPVKGAEVGKLRPVVILSASDLLDISPPFLFVAPLSSRSRPEYSIFHVPIAARGDLRTDSYVLVEHCRTISSNRLCSPLLAQLSSGEIDLILQRLLRMVGH